MWFSPTEHSMFSGMTESAPPTSELFPSSYRSHSRNKSGTCIQIHPSEPVHPAGSFVMSCTLSWIQSKKGEELKRERPDGFTLLTECWW